MCMQVVDSSFKFDQAIHTLSLFIYSSSYSKQHIIRLRDQQSTCAQTTTGALLHVHNNHGVTTPSLTPHTHTMLVLHSTIHPLRPTLQRTPLARQHASPMCAASPSTTTPRTSSRPTQFDRASFKHALQAAEISTCLQQAEALVTIEDGQLSTQGRLHLYNQLQGLHQQLFRKLLHSRDLDGIQRYLRLLPPKPRLFTSLMKECTIQGNQDALNAVLQVYWVVDVY